MTNIKFNVIGLIDNVEDQSDSSVSSEHSLIVIKEFGAQCNQLWSGGVAFSAMLGSADDCVN